MGSLNEPVPSPKLLRVIACPNEQATSTLRNITFSKLGWWDSEDETLSGFSLASKDQPTPRCYLHRLQQLGRELLSGCLDLSGGCKAVAGNWICFPNMSYYVMIRNE